MGTNLQLQQTFVPIAVTLQNLTTHQIHVLCKFLFRYGTFYVILFAITTSIFNVNIMYKISKISFIISHKIKIAYVKLFLNKNKYSGNTKFLL